MSTENFQPTDADLEKAWHTSILERAAAILWEREELRYEAVIHGLKYMEDDPNEHRTK